MAIMHVELHEYYLSETKIVVHGTSHYYTMLYILNEDQARSYTRRIVVMMIKPNVKHSMPYPKIRTTNKRI